MKDRCESKKISKFSTVFLWYFCVGVLYSYFFPLLGFTFLYYLVRFSIAHAVTIGFTIGFLGVVLESLAGFRYTKSLIAIILFTHGSIWAIYFHDWQRLTSTTFIVIVSGAIFFLYLLLSSSEFFYSNRYSTVIFLSIFAVSLTSGKALLSHSLSNSYIRNGISEDLREEPNILNNYLYPFSIPLEQGLSQYPYLVPNYTPKKGIILIMADALRRDYIGVKLKGYDITPNIDELAEDGIKFSRYYVQGTWTPASTASLFTGKYVRQHGICFGSKPGKGQVLPKRYQTLAERLEKQGYYSLGTVFNGHLASRAAYDQGFDFWADPFNDYIDDYISSQELIFNLLRRQPKKFFIYWHAEGPHYPYGVSPANKSYWNNTEFYNNGNLVFPEWDLGEPGDIRRGVFREEKKKTNQSISKEEIQVLRHFYLAKLNYYDKNYLEPFLTSLRANDLLSNSLTVFTSDHGEELFDHSKNGAFGHTRFLFQTVINPPLIINLPQTNLSENFKDSKPTLESIDLTATLLDYAGASREDVKGKSFLGYLRSNSKTDFNYEYAISERCSRLKEGELTPMSAEKFREKVGIIEAAYVRPPWKLNWYYSKEKDGLQQTRLYRIQNQVIKESQVENRHDKVRSLKKKLDRAVGSDTHFQVNPGPVKNFSNERTEHFKGLGYVD